ncbi:MAG TPA: hypothetical protein VKS24_03380 [Bradyrhizobium sp.]|nr:hypothetical protein [Bradyrhizobium sp.]
MIKAADMMIARRADTRARADFATWNMMAKLNGASSLPPEAQSFLDRYRALLKEKREAEATDAIVQLIYKSYYEEMGGSGEPPDIKAHPVAASKTTGNVTAFKRSPPQRKKAQDSQTKPRLPVALIFACLVVVYTGFRYFLR